MSLEFPRGGHTERRNNEARRFAAFTWGSLIHAS
jgi:hypothetical protein